MLINEKNDRAKGKLKILTGFIGEAQGSPSSVGTTINIIILYYFESKEVHFGG